MTIPAGSMNKRVRFERRYDSQDATGQPTTTWRTLVTRRASLRTKSTTESYTNTGELSTYTDEIKIRYDSESSEITTGDRAIYIQTGDVYDIEGVTNDMSMDKVIVLKCKYRSRGLSG